MFCPKCGNKIHDESLYCASCGTRLSDLGIKPAGANASGVNSSSELLPAATVPSANGDTTPSGSVNVYGGFWRRVGASVIDSLILYAALIVVILLVPSENAFEETSTGAAFLLAVSPTLIAWLYSALFESSSRQATLGKMALGVKVTDLSGERLGFGRATGRFFGKYVSALTLCIGFAMAGFTQRRQALHDKIAGTLVLRKGADAAELTAHPVAPKVAGWAVVLLVVAVCILPVTGILAAIAIPAYQDYLIRAQVSEGLVSAAAYKAAVAEAVASGTNWEYITTEALGFEARAPSKYLESSEVINGVVVLTYGDQANSKIANKQLLLVPGVSNRGEVVWVCGYGAAPDGVELVIENHEQYTDVEPKYLPSACRS